MAIPPLDFVQRSEEAPITEEEIFERFKSPNAVSRNLFDQLAGWENKARAVLSDHGIHCGDFPTNWPAHVKAAPAEAQDAWRVLLASYELRKALHAKEPHEVFGLALAGIRLGQAIMEAHTRPHTRPAAIGYAVQSGGIDGAKQKHGTKKDREARYEAMRQRYEDLRASGEIIGHHEITDRIGDEFGISGRRVRDHIANAVSPRKPRKKV